MLPTLQDHPPRGSAAREIQGAGCESVTPCLRLTAVEPTHGTHVSVPPATASHVFEEHTGELRLRIDAATLAELFAEAGRALALLACGDQPLPPPEGEAERVSLSSHDRAALLVDWLNELVFRAEAEDKVFSEFRFARLADRDLDARIRGAHVPEMRTLVKAATLHDLELTEDPDGASATVVLDV